MFACLLYHIDTADLFHIVVLFKSRFVCLQTRTHTHTLTLGRCAQIFLNMDSFPAVLFEVIVMLHVSSMMRFIL